MSVSIGDAMSDALDRVMRGEVRRITKRATWEMAFSHYIPEGWKVLRSEGRTVLLIWPQEGAPT